MNNPNARNIIFRGIWAADRVKAERRNLAQVERFIAATADPAEIAELKADKKRLEASIAGLLEICGSVS